jgi:uncharacterized Ntn-hydrolase superfamily protein
MRALLGLVLVLGCSKSSSTSEPPAKRGDYCRGKQQVTAIAAPLGTAPGSGSTIPAHTFSIVARDPVTGQMGVAVQSHFFGVGSLVTWAQPGVGAVATQSFVEPAYGPKGLALMASGVAPADALAQLVAEDKGQAVRQVAFVDAKGRAAAHTGASCIEFANHFVGDGFTVEANMMANDKVIPAMTKAYQDTKGDLAERMLAALDAAQAVGGDIRGCQSAAILVVSGNQTDTPWKEKLLDLRVEDSPDPLPELRRLVVNARAYDHSNRGDLAMEKKDVAGALAEYDTAMKMLPDNIELKFWVGATLLSLGKVDDSKPLLQAAFKDDPAWIELSRRLFKPGILPDTPEGRANLDKVLRDMK